MAETSEVNERGYSELVGCKNADSIFKHVNCLNKAEAPPELINKSYRKKHESEGEILQVG